MLVYIEIASIVNKVAVVETLLMAQISWTSSKELESVKWKMFGNFLETTISPFAESMEWTDGKCLHVFHLQLSPRNSVDVGIFRSFHSPLESMTLPFVKAHLNRARTAGPSPK